MIQRPEVKQTVFNCARLPRIGAKLLHTAMLFSALLSVGLAISSLLQRYRDADTNTDIAWYLHVAQRVLHGETLYHDVIEINPPLIIWLNLPAVVLSDLTGASDVAVFRLLVVGLITISLTACHDLLRALFPGTAAIRWSLTAVVLLCLLYLPGVLVFGEREHLLLAFFLPYFLLSCCRCLGIDPHWSSRGMIGLFAGVGIALKPHFVLAWLAIEAYVLIQRRRLFGRVEFVAVGLLGALYAGSVWLMYPEYIALVRSAAASYHGFSHVDYGRFLMTSGLLSMLVLAIAVLITRPPRVEKTVCCAGLTLAVTMYVIAVVQAKGFGYHLYPAHAISVLCLAILVPKTLQWNHFGRPLAMGAALIVIGQAVIGSAGAVAKQHLGLSHFDALRDVVLAETDPGDSIYVMSVDMSPSFPLVNETHRSWAARFPSLWLLWSQYSRQSDRRGMTVSQAAKSGMTIGMEDIPADDRFARFFCDSVVSDLVGKRPRLLLVHRTCRYQSYGQVIDFLQYFSADPRFQSLLNDYSNVGRVGDFDLLKRTTSAVRPRGTADRPGVSPNVAMVGPN